MATDGAPMPPLQLYAAFDGDYSDRCCIGIFSTKEKAEAASRAGDRSPNDVEVVEYELDKADC